MNDLTDALDTVWKTPGDRQEAARQEVARIGPRARLQLIAVDIAASLGLVPRAIRLDPDLRRATLEGPDPVTVRLVEPGEVCDITYAEGVQVSVEGAGIVKEARSLTNALAAAQVARDHSDGLAFLPQDLRMSRIRGYADAFDMDVGNFARLAANFPALQRAL